MCVVYVLVVMIEVCEDRQQEFCCHKEGFIFSGQLFAVDTLHVTRASLLRSILGSVEAGLDAAPASCVESEK